MDCIHLYILDNPPKCGRIIYSKALTYLNGNREVHTHWEAKLITKNMKTTTTLTLVCLLVHPFLTVWGILFYLWHQISKFSVTMTSFIMVIKLIFEFQCFVLFLQLLQRSARWYVNRTLSPMRGISPSLYPPIHSHSYTKDSHSTRITLLFLNSAWVLLRPTELSTIVVRRDLWFYHPCPRRLESLTICRWNYKGSTFSSVT